MTEETTPKQAAQQTEAERVAAQKQQVQTFETAKAVSDKEAAQKLATQQSDASKQDAQKLSKEDQLKLRILSTVSLAFPSHRDVEIEKCDSAGPNFYIVEMAYTPGTGDRQDTKALVFDNGDLCFILGTH